MFQCHVTHGWIRISNFWVAHKCHGSILNSTMQFWMWNLLRWKHWWDCYGNSAIALWR
jgi:hypothetical protein